MSSILSSADRDPYGDPYDSLPICDPYSDRDAGWSTLESPVSLPGWAYPTSSDPDQLVLIDGSVICAAWCREADGHPGAIDDTERTCVSPRLRLIPAAGGGRSAHARPAGCRCTIPADCPTVPSADATVTVGAEQVPGEPPAIVLATEVAGVEQHVILTIDETDRLAADLLTVGMRVEGVRD